MHYYNFVKAEKDEKLHHKSSLGFFFSSLPKRPHLRPLPRQIQTRLLRSLKVPPWPLDQKLGSSLLHLLTITSSCSFLSCHTTLSIPYLEFKELTWHSGFSTLTLPNTSTLNSSQIITKPHPLLPPVRPPFWEACSPSSGHLVFHTARRLRGRLSQERESPGREQ